MGNAKKVAIAMILSILLASCGGQKDSSLDKQTSLAEQLRSTIAVQCRDGLDGIQEASDLRLEVSEAGADAVLRLYTDREAELAQVLYELRYPSARFSCTAAEISPLLGGEDEIVSLAHLDYPGMVSLGQVRVGLERTSVENGQLFAELVFSQGPGRSSSAFDPVEGGLKLRVDGENDADLLNDDDHQFDNADVPFRVTDLDEGIYQIQWEEANDGDYDHNGIVSINDLTPIGVYFDDFLNYNESGWETTEKTYGGSGQSLFIHRSNSSLAIRNINLSSFPVGAPPDSYAPFLRYCDEITTNAPDPPTDPNDIDFLVNASDITRLGQNFQHSTLGGYDIYLVSCWGSAKPSNFAQWVDDLTLGQANPRKLNIDPIQRPSTSNAGTPIGNLGFVLPGYEDLTYSQFCQNTTLCNTAETRMASSPLNSEYRMFMTQVNVGNIPLGAWSSYVCVTPRSGGSGTDFSIYNDGLGAFTYHPSPVASADLNPPVGVNWLSSETGVQELELGDPNTESTRHQLSIRIGEAQFTTNNGTTHNDYLAAGWRIKYMLFMAPADALSGFWDMYEFDEDLPETQWFPDSMHANRFRLYDIDRPVDGWIHLPNHAKSDWLGKDVYVGARACAYREIGDSGMPWQERETSIDSNTIQESIAFPGNLQPNVDESAPFLNGMSWQQSPFGYAEAIESTSRDVTFDGQQLFNVSAAYTLVSGHPDSITTLGSTSFSRPSVFFGRNALWDADENGGERSIQDVELRLEVYRTIMDEATVRARISHAGGIGPWKAGLSQSFDAQLYGIALTYPDQLSTDPQTKGFTTHDDDWQWCWADEFGDICRHTYYCPPMWGTYEDDSARENFYDNSSLFPDIDSLGMDTLTGSGYMMSHYTPTDLPAWGAFDPSATPPVCDTDFGWQSSLKFVYDDNLEFSQGRQFNYLTVAAANDPEENCGYSLYMTWHGPVSSIATNAFTNFYTKFYYQETLVEGFYSGQTARLPELLEDSAPCTGDIRGASIVQPDSPLRGPEVRYPDIAINPANGTIGVSYVIPGSGTVALHEWNPLNYNSAIQTVDNGSIGDTSVVYDSSGNPHVAYYRITGQGGGTTGVGAGINKGSSTLDYSGGVYYRKRSGLSWNTRQEVDDAGALNSTEHQIQLNAQGMPYCLIPSDGVSQNGSPGVPGIAKQSGTSLNVSDLQTSGGPTNQNIDSLTINVSGREMTYVVMVDPVAGSLVLGTLTDQNPATWSTVILDSNDIGGYPCISHLPNGTIAVSYMAGSGNRLRYGTWNGSSFSVAFESIYDETGYQSAITYDSSGNPWVLSIGKEFGMMMLARFDGSRWIEHGLWPVLTRDDLIGTNTVSIAETSGMAFIAYILPDGRLGFAKMKR